MEGRDESTSKRSKMDICQHYVRPAVLSSMLQVLRDTTLVVNRSICLVGSKGVGKTTLLRALNTDVELKSAYFDLKRVNNWSTFNENVRELEEGTGTGDRVVLFLDNIQDAVRDEGARRIISTYVKQPAHNRKIQVIAASSRAGLFKLRTDSDLHLNSNDFFLCYIIPEENVTIEVMKKVFPNYAEEEPVYMRWLTSAGFVVGEVFQLQLFLKMEAANSSRETLDQLLKLFTKYREISLRDTIKEDEKLFPIDSKHIFINCLAVCVVGRGVPIHNLGEYKMTPSDLPWTLLMVKNRILTAVSPQAKAAMQSFVRKNKDLVKQMLHLVDAIAHGSSGSMRGVLFEEFFFQALPGWIIVLKRHDCNDEEVNLQIVFPAVDAVTQKILGDFLPERNCCYYTPQMQDVDIILNVDDKIFLIQCSISREIGAKKGFWKTAENRKLNAVLAGPSHVEEHLKDTNSQLAKEYKQNKFAFVLCNLVLGDDFVNLLAGQ